MKNGLMAPIILAWDTAYHSIKKRRRSMGDRGSSGHNSRAAEFACVILAARRYSVYGYVYIRQDERKPDGH